MDYRVHDDNISQAMVRSDFDTWSEHFFARALWHRREGVKAFCQMLSDLHCPPGADWPPMDFERGRFVAIEKLQENEFFRQYYDGATTIRAGHRWMALGRLARALAKLTLKSWLPPLKRRDARWHYRRMLAEGGSSK